MHPEVQSYADELKLRIIFVERPGIGLSSQWSQRSPRTTGQWAKDIRQLSMHYD